jgi:hypothetical protein
MLGTQPMADRGRGRPTKRPSGEQLFSVRMPKKLHRTLRLLCTAKGLALNDIAVEALDAWLKGQPEARQYGKLADEQIKREEAEAEEGE